MVYLLHKIVISFYLPIVIAFKIKPGIKMVVFDSYLDLVFLVEIICTFFTAYTGINKKLVTNKKKIAIHYILGTFIFDVLACVPFTALHLRSQTWPMDDDLVPSILSLNFNGVPNFYRIIICVKIVRMNHIRDYWDFCLKNICKNA